MFTHSNASCFIVEKLHDIIQEPSSEPVEQEKPKAKLNETLLASVIAFPTCNFRFFSTHVSLVHGLAGVPRNLKGGRGAAQFEAVRLPPKVKRRAKKGHHAIRLSFIRISPLHHENFLHLSAGGKGAVAPMVHVLDNAHAHPGFSKLVCFSARSSASIFSKQILLLTR